MEVSYCTFRFGAIIRRDLRNNHYMFVNLVNEGKATHACLADFVQRYNNSVPHVTLR